MSQDATVGPLLATKLHTPVARGPRVPRPRLDALLERGVEGPLTLVSSPAGWGKTSLVADWAQRCRRKIAWVSLDEHDRQPARLLGYLCAALSRVDRRVDEGLALAIEGNELDPRTGAITLLNALAEGVEPAIVVLDDLHRIGGPEPHELLLFLIDNAPACLHVVVCTRADPPLPLARLRAHGLLAEVRAADLRFTAAEAASLLAVELDPASLAKLHARTEGWAVGLQMAALSLGRHHDPAAFVASVSASHRFVLDYLMDEVLGQLEPTRREQLVRLSVVPTLDPEVVETLTGVASGSRLLAELEADNLFVVPLDDHRRAYRFHHLFGDLLRRELDATTSAEQREQLHGSVAALREAQGDLEAAVEHALAARSWDEVERMALTLSAHALIRSNISAMVALFDRIPASELARRPALVVRRLWLATLTGVSSARLRLWTTRAEAALREQPLAMARAELDLMHAIAASSGSPSLAKQLYARAAEVLGDRPGIVPAYLHLNRARLWVAEDRHEDALASAERMFEAVVGIDDPYALMWARWYRAHVHLMKGEPTQTIEIMLSMLDAFREGLGQGMPRSAALGLSTLVHAHLERGELDEAARWFDEAQALADPRVAPQDAAELCLTWAGLEALRDPGGPACARALTRGAELLREFDLLGYAPRLSAMRVRISLHGDAGPGAEAVLRGWVDHPDLDEGTHPVFSVPMSSWSRPDFARLLRARAWVRLGRQPERAREELEQLVASAEAVGRHACAIEARLAQAELAERGAEPEHRDAHLQRALALAARSQVIAPLLTLPSSLRARVHALLPEGQRDAFPWGRAVGPVAMPTPPDFVPVTLVDPLTERELEVLSLVARGLSNAEVARSLYVAPSTVKKHLEHVYAKLDVRRRTQAVARARELGLLG